MKWFDSRRNDASIAAYSPTHTQKHTPRHGLPQTQRCCQTPSEKKRARARKKCHPPPVLLLLLFGSGSPREPSVSIHCFFCCFRPCFNRVQRGFEERETKPCAREGMPCPPPTASKGANSGAPTYLPRLRLDIID